MAPLENLPRVLGAAPIAILSSCGNVGVSWQHIVDVSDVAAAAVFQRNPVLHLAGTRPGSYGSLEVAGLEIGMTYSFAVRIKSASTGTWSTLSPFGPTLINSLQGRPAAPTALRLASEPARCENLALLWTTASCDIAEYEVTAQLPSGRVWRRTVVESKLDGLGAESCGDATSLSLRVRARNSVGWGELSERLTVSLDSPSSWRLARIAAVVACAAIALAAFVYRRCDFSLLSRRAWQHQALRTTDYDQAMPSAQAIEFSISDDEDEEGACRLREHKPTAFCRFQSLLQQQEKVAAEREAELEAKLFEMRTSAASAPPPPIGATLLPPPALPGLTPPPPPPVPPLLPPPPVCCSSGGAASQLLAQIGAGVQLRSSRSVSSSSGPKRSSGSMRERPSSYSDLMAQISGQQFALRPVDTQSRRAGGDRRDGASFTSLGGLAAELYAAMRRRRESIDTGDHTDSPRADAADGEEEDEEEDWR